MRTAAKFDRCRTSLGKRQFQKCPYMLIGAATHPSPDYLITNPLTSQIFYILPNIIMPNDDNCLLSVIL